MVELKRQAHIAALLVGVPSFAVLASADPPTTAALASPGGLAAAVGALAAVLIWRRAAAALPVYIAWAALCVAASLYPTLQLPGELAWSLLLSLMFAAVLVILGRQVRRVTRQP